MLFRVSFWNDRTDTEVFGKIVEAENECKAEEKFFDELEDENDYSDEFPVLVQETEEDEDEYVEDDRSELPWAYGKHFE